MNLQVYGAMERDAERAPRVAIGRLAAHERCLLYRRRAGFTQARVAKELKISRYWLNLMELGKVECDALVWYWEQ